MPQVLGIDHIAFAAHDLEATCVFYHRLFGAPDAFRLCAGRKEPGSPDRSGWRLAQRIHQFGNGLRYIVAKHPTVGGADICLRWSGDAENAVELLRQHGIPIVAWSVRRDRLLMGFRRTRSTSETRMAIW